HAQEGKTFEEKSVAADTSSNSVKFEESVLNASAARSLGEGMEESLTVDRLRLPMQLRKILVFSILSRFAKSETVGKAAINAESESRYSLRITGQSQERKPY